MLHEWFRQTEAEAVSKSRNKIHQTWCTDFSQSLYCIKWYICSAMKCCYISLKYGKPLINWSDLIFWVKLSPIGTGRRGIWCGMSGPSLKGERERDVIFAMKEKCIDKVCLSACRVCSWHFPRKFAIPAAGSPRISHARKITGVEDIPNEGCQSLKFQILQSATKY